MIFRAPSYSVQPDLIYAVLCRAIQGDLFSEAPKPPVSEEKKVQNESMKSTAQTAGNT